jgi:hypothetical protein
MPFETLLLPCLVFFGKINPAPASTFSLTDPSGHTSKSNSPRAAMVASVAVFFSSSLIASLDCADHTVNHPVPSVLFSFCHSLIGAQDLELMS